MIKLAVFDIDNTLAKINKPLSQNVAEKLRKLQNVGIKVALISGKPASYIRGFARGAGLRDVLIAGENGGVVFNPFTLEVKHLKKRPKSLDIIERNVRKKFAEKIWLQPNEVILTIFPRESVKVANVRKFVENTIRKNHMDDVYILTHRDAIDVLPKNLDKGVAIKYFCEILKLSRDKVATVGDSESDIPMFESSGFSILIGSRGQQRKFKASKVANEILLAIDTLIKKGGRING
jgi:HAD superfamily hydrolase (TIGR01484 family)